MSSALESFAAHTIQLAVVLFFATLLCWELGRRIGRHRSIADPDGWQAGTGVIEGAAFGLLGLILGFTFSGAATRLDARRHYIVDEANAIGTAWLRLDLVSPSAQPAMRETMRAYVDARIATYRAVPDLSAVRREAARASDLQNRLWSQAVAAVRSPEVRGATEQLLMPALNDMFDIASTRLAARLIHPPLVIYAMLFALVIAAALLAGY